jgi:hypothetical protein
LLISTQKRFLNDLLGIAAITRDSIRDPEQSGRVPFDDRAIGVLVTVQNQA